MSTDNSYASEVYSTIGKKLYLNEELADFHFIFETDDGHCERVPAHKLLLTMGSDVFRAMFNGSWKDKNETKITDASAAAFKQFLQFFYINTVEMSTDHIAKVMYLGDKYNVPNCISVCEKFMINSLAVDNVLSAYEVGIAINQVNLNKYCEYIISKDTKAVLEAESFLECNRNVLSQIMKMEHLSCSEVELFEAYMRWVKDASEQDEITKEIIQSELGDLFYGFRFGSMSVEEFATLDPSYGHLFSSDEYREIIRMIGSTKLMPTKFNGNRQKRQGEIIQSFNGAVVQCNRLLSLSHPSISHRIRNIETTKFSTNESMFLVAFVYSEIYIPDSNNGWYTNITEALSSDITIATSQDPKDSSKEIVFYKGKTYLQSEHSSRIPLTKPIHIKKDLIYEIRMKQTPPPNCRAPALLKSEVRIEPDIKIQFYDDPVVEYDKVARGLILGLELKKI